MIYTDKCNNINPLYSAINTGCLNLVLLSEISYSAKNTINIFAVFPENLDFDYNAFLFTIL